MNHPTDWAADAVNSLAMLPGFPAPIDREARAFLASRLRAILTSGAESLPDLELHARDLAHEIVDRLAEFDRWPGPAVFFQIARRMRFGDGSDYASRDIPHLSAYLPPAAAATGCEACDDLGYRVSAAGYERCACPAGQALGQTFLDLLNGRKPEPLHRPTADEIERVIHKGHEVTEVVTEADIERAVQAHRIGRALAELSEEGLDPCP